MGMFDYVDCEYPLPEPQYQDLEYQTKSLECMMWHYRITEDGQLLAPIHREERIPDEEIEAEEFEPLRNFRRACPFRLVVDRWEPLLDAQTIYFYGTVYHPPVDEDDDGHDLMHWIEWKAQFVGGRLISIERGPRWETDRPHPDAVVPA